MRLTPNLVQLIGLAAASLSAITFAPQVWRTWRTRSAGDVSGATLGIVVASIGLWLIYGWALQDVPILLANSLNLVFTLLLSYYKWRFRGNERPAGPGKPT